MSPVVFQISEPAQCYSSRTCVRAGKQNTEPRMNYDKCKKKCSSILMIMITALKVSPSDADYVIEKCSVDDQKEIFLSQPGCLPRDTLVDLREKYSQPSSDIIEVVPDHVTVERCGGSCYVQQYTCNPISTSTITVPVMLVQAQWPHGEHQVLCDQVQVEVHHECQCGCKVEEHQCHKEKQYYHQPSCRYSIFAKLSPTCN